MVISLSLIWPLTHCTPTQSTEQVMSNVAALEEVQPPVGSQSSLPYLIRGDDDHLYLSWVEDMDTLAYLKYSRYDSTGWTSAETIAKGSNWFVNWADYPMMAVDSGGNMIAHYLAKSSEGTYSYDVNITIKPAGTSAWSSPIVPHRDHTPTEHGFVSLLPRNDGTFLLAWLDGRNTGGGHDGQMHSGAMTLRTATIDMNGSLSQEAELDNRICDCCQTTASLTSAGPMVAYRDRSVDEIRDMAFVHLNQGDSWTKPSLVAADNWKIEGCPVNGPRMDSFGETTAVAWFSAANSRPVVKVAFKEAAEDFQEPIMVDTRNPIGRVDLVLLDEENALVSWVSGGNDAALMVRKISKSGALSSVVKVASMSPERASGFPQLENNGNVLFFAMTEIINENSTVKLKKIQSRSLF